jgi:hypothetical protein
VIFAPRLTPEDPVRLSVKICWSPLDVLSRFVEIVTVPALKVKAPVILANSVVLKFISLPLLCVPTSIVPEDRVNVTVPVPALIAWLIAKSLAVILILLLEFEVMPVMEFTDPIVRVVAAESTIVIAPEAEEVAATVPKLFEVLETEILPAAFKERLLAVMALESEIAPPVLVRLTV